MAIERVMNITHHHRDHDVSTSLLSRKAIPSYPYTPTGVRTLYASPKREEEENIALYHYHYHLCTTICNHPYCLVVVGSSSQHDNNRRASRQGAFPKLVRTERRPMLNNNQRKPCTSPHNVYPPPTLHRTVEKIMTSLSRPWNKSMVDKVMDEMRVAGLQLTFVGLCGGKDIASEFFWAAVLDV